MHGPCHRAPPVPVACCTATAIGRARARGGTGGRAPASAFLRPVVIRRPVATVGPERGIRRPPPRAAPAAVPSGRRGPPTLDPAALVAPPLPDPLPGWRRGEGEPGRRGPPTLDPVPARRAPLPDPLPGWRRGEGEPRSHTVDGERSSSGLGRARRGGGVVPLRRAGRCGRTRFRVRSRGARTVSPSATGSSRLLHRNRHRSRPRARWHGRTCPGVCVSPPGRHTAPGRDCRPGARDPTTPSPGSARGGPVRSVSAVRLGLRSREGQSRSRSRSRSRSTSTTTTTSTSR